MTGLPSVYASAAGAAGSGTVVNQVMSEGVGGVVNELLVQMQSFDEPTGWQKAARQAGRPASTSTCRCTASSSGRTPPSTNLLLIAATNRADNLDPALLRPGRFDRRLTFELPTKRGRRELIDHFLASKAHVPELDDPTSGATRWPGSPRATRR